MSGVTDSTFVATMTELNRIDADEGLDSARRVSARDSVLQGRDLTAAQLEAAARALADDPDRAYTLWQRIVRNAENGAPR